MVNRNPHRESTKREIEKIAICLIGLDRADHGICIHNHDIDIDERGLIWIDGKKIPDYDKSDWKERYWDASEYMRAARTLHREGYYVRYPDHYHNSPLLFTPDGYPAEGVRAGWVNRSFKRDRKTTQAKRSRTRKNSRKTTPANFGGIKLGRVF